jgi:quinol monooxygenase YgiN
MVMDSPWITFAPADAHREYHALLSYLPLNKYSAVPGFFRFSFQIQKQLRTTPGVVGYALRAKILSRNFCTISVWEDQKALTEFVAKIPHCEAIRAMTPHMGASKFTQWKVAGSSLPLSWNEAMQRLQPGAPS